MQMDAEAYAWLQVVRFVAVLPGSLDAQLQRMSGVNSAEFYVLVHVSNSPDRTLQLSDIAKVSNMSLSRLSHLVARLEAKGLGTRSPSVANGRRVTLVTVTNAGASLVEAVLPQYLEYLRRTAFSLLAPGELEKLAALSQYVLDGIEHN